MQSPPYLIFIKVYRGIGHVDRSSRVCFYGLFRVFRLLLNLSMIWVWKTSHWRHRVRVRFLFKSAGVLTDHRLTTTGVIFRSRHIYRWCAVEKNPLFKRASVVFCSRRAAAFAWQIQLIMGGDSSHRTLDRNLCCSPCNFDRRAASGWKSWAQVLLAFVRVCNSWNGMLPLQNNAWAALDLVSFFSSNIVLEAFFWERRVLKRNRKNRIKAVQPNLLINFNMFSICVVNNIIANHKTCSL